MLHTSTSGRSSERTLVDRVLSALASFSCARVWARPVGRHVLLGLNGEGPFARLTALAGGLYGLAFQREQGGRWDLLLIDDLTAVVEHALIGAGALSG